MQIADALIAAGAAVCNHNAQGMSNARRELAAAVFCGGAFLAADSAHGVVIAMEWGESIALDLDWLRRAKADPVLTDSRILLDSEEVRRSGFRYASVGRSAADR